MDIGIFVFQTDLSLDVAVLAKRAEELGFESFWVPEHALVPVSTTSPYPGAADGIIPEEYKRVVDPFVALARASGVTQRMKLGTGVCLVPERNPLLLAKEVATLDRFSGGRFLFGVGSGWLKEETEIMGGDFPHRWTQTRDAVLAMKQLWTNDRAEYHGEYYDFPPVLSFPKPIQKPHPPIFLGGRAKNVFKRIVEWADGWMPNRITAEELKRGRATLDELASHAGRDPSSIEVIAFGVNDLLNTPESVRGLEEAGVSRAIFRLGQAEDESALTEMEAIAKKVIG